MRHAQSATQNKVTRLENTRVLVTGGAGFIGSNLVEALLLQNNEVVCLDNFATGKKENIEVFLKHKHFHFIEGDIRKLNDCKKATDGVEYVFHQAALGSVPRSIKDPATTNEVNISGFLNMLIAARDAKVKRFVYASSSSVYGDSEQLPKTEDKTGTPLSPYAITKAVNELYARNFSAIYGIQTIGLRYFNVFGKRQDPEGEYAAVIPRFIRLLLQHQSPQIFGNGEQSRDFTYIGNVVQANQCAALAPGGNAINTAYNIAFGERATLNELFELLVGLLSAADPAVKNIKPTYIPERPGDIRHSLASIDKARTLLGYDPQFSLRKGLEEATEWYCKKLA